MKFLIQRPNTVVFQIVQRSFQSPSTVKLSNKSDYCESVSRKKLCLCQPKLSVILLLPDRRRGHAQSLVRSLVCRYEYIPRSLRPFAEPQKTLVIPRWWFRRIPRSLPPFLPTLLAPLSPSLSICLPAAFLSEWRNFQISVPPLPRPHW